MPKVNHRAKGRHASSIDDIKARNSGEFVEKGKGKGKGKDKPQEESEEESEEEEQDTTKEPQGKTRGTAGMEVENPNLKVRNEERDGVELTRKQREEIQKAAAKKRYEERHKAGKTDEAMADLARLQEVKQRREEAAKKREAEAKEAAEKEAEKGKKGGMSSEVRDALGGEAARMRGERSQAKKDTEEPKRTEGPGRAQLDHFTTYAGSEEDKKPKAPIEAPKKDGSIQSCRAQEEDFM